MRRLVVIVQPDQVNGYRLAGLEALAVDDPDLAAAIITPWLEKGEEILLAMGESVYQLLSQNLADRIHASSHMLLVTIPDGQIRQSENRGQQRIFDAIRHANGVQIRFKGEIDGKKS